MTRLEKRAYKQALKDMRDDFKYLIKFDDVPLLDIPHGYTT